MEKLLTRFGESQLRVPGTTATETYMQHLALLHPTIVSVAVQCTRSKIRTRACLISFVGLKEKACSFNDLFLMTCVSPPSNLRLQPKNARKAPPPNTCSVDANANAKANLDRSEAKKSQSPPSSHPSNRLSEHNPLPNLTANAKVIT